MNSNTNVWPEKYEEMCMRQIMSEARQRFRINQLPDDLKDWEETRTTLRGKLWSHLGTAFDDSVELDLQIHGETQMDGYVVQNISYQSKPGFYVTGNLYIPYGEGPFPGVINMHGHWAQGRLADRVQQRGHTLAKNGYVCLCVDAFGSGERSNVHGEYEYHGNNLGGALLNIGETLMGMQVVDNMRGVSLLQSLNYVDKNNIGATGASGGGNQTMWLAAMDERVKAAVPVVSVGTFESYIGATNCICECLPNGLTFTEESGVLALVAPRALKICNAIGDTNITFYPQQMLRSYEQAKKVFRLYGAGEKLANEIFNRPHGYWPIVRETMLGWFDRWLKGTGDGSSREEIAFQTLPEETVMCFKKGGRPVHVQSIAQFCRSRGKLLQENVLKQTLEAEAKKYELVELLKLNNSNESVKEIIPHYKLNIAGNLWESFTIRTAEGSISPILVKRPKSGAHYTISISHEGKDAVMHGEEFKGVIDSDRGVILFDLWGTGETLPSDDAGTASLSMHHTLARSCLWLGKPMMGIWTNNLRLIAEFAKETLKAEDLSCQAKGYAGISALFAEIAFDVFSEIKLSKAPASYIYAENKPGCGLSFHVPGIMNWGDIALALGLCKCKIEFETPTAIDGKEYSEAEIDKLASMVQKLKNEVNITSEVVFSA